MTKNKRRHRPEQIVAKLRDAEVMLNSGKDLAAVLQSLEICEATYHRSSNWRWKPYTSNQVTPGKMVTQKAFIVACVTSC